MIYKDLANKLINNTNYNVLLIEAGPKDSSPIVHVPLGYGMTFYNKKINSFKYLEKNKVYGNIKEGLFDYLIVCDERNNTPSVIDANELVVDIYIKPTRTAEYILVNFFATRTDANFEEIIGG